MGTRKILTDITVIKEKIARNSPTGKPPATSQSMWKMVKSADVSPVQSPKHSKNRFQLIFSNVSSLASNVSRFISDIKAQNKRTSFSITDLRICTQEERLHHIKSECNKLRPNMSKAFLKPGTKTIADEIHHLLYCFMPKIACTAFKVLLTKANVHAMGQNEAYPKGMDVHQAIKLSRKYKLLQLRHFNATEVASRLRDYFKFMIMRHPFERLISAWRDKVVHLEQSPCKDWPARILKHTRPFLFGNSSAARSAVITNKDMEIASKHSPPRFDEFVTWIAEKEFENEHWMSAVKFCHVCANDWDAIFRIETMVADKRILLDKLKADIDQSEDIALVHSMQNNLTFFFPVKELDLWKNVSRPVVKYFLEKYKDDMQLFGYQWDNEHSRTVCSISTPSGPCC